MINFFVKLILVNIVFMILFKVYCKMTCGICKCSRHLVGKTAIVTGGNTGIGLETARDLALRGARVLLACRSEPRGRAAVAALRANTAHRHIHYRHLDLADLASVRAFAQHVLATEPRLDILVNNAGVFNAPNDTTKDGLLLTMQCNHFGPFLLTNLLLPLLKASAPSRIITVSSRAYTAGEIDFDNLNMEKIPKESIKSMKVYSNSKLCNVLMTVELERQLKGTGVIAKCLHPGVVATEIGRHLSPIFLKIASIVRWLIPKNTWEGAQTSIYLCVSPDVTETSGVYYSDCAPMKTSRLAQDTELAQKLWKESEKHVGLKINASNRLGESSHIRQYC